MNVLASETIVQYIGKLYGELPDLEEMKDRVDPLITEENIIYSIEMHKNQNPKIVLKLISDTTFL